MQSYKVSLQQTNLCKRQLTGPNTRPKCAPRQTSKDLAYIRRRYNYSQLIVANSRRPRSEGPPKGIRAHGEIEPNLRQSAAVEVEVLSSSKLALLLSWSDRTYTPA